MFSRRAGSRASLALGLIAIVGPACSKGSPAHTPGRADGSGGAASGGSVAAGAGGSGGMTSAPGAGGTLVGTGSTAPSGGVSGSGGAAGATAGQGGAPADPADAGAPAPIDEAFAAAAVQIAADYTAWGRVDDELRWAPWLCRIPLPGIVRPSDSNGATTHGQKLYSVFAKNHDAYPAGPQDGQVVVKQSWTAELVTSPDAAFSPASARFEPDAGDHFYGYAQGDGGVYRAGQLAGLYIMFRLDPATPDTDEGWVYATITADGQVTAAGRVASCMGCHEVATHERLFGVPLSPTLPN